MDDKFLQNLETLKAKISTKLEDHPGIKAALGNPKNKKFEIAIVDNFITFRTGDSKKNETYLHELVEDVILDNHLPLKLEGFSAAGENGNTYIFADLSPKPVKNYEHEVRGTTEIPDTKGHSLLESIKLAGHRLIEELKNAGRRQL
jgi:hypothetical protein